MIIKAKRGVEDEAVMILDVAEDEANSDGTVDVWGTDADGKRYLILYFDQDGVYLMDGLPDTTGWPLDSQGRIKVHK